MRVSTYLNAKQYELFKTKAKQLNMKEYQLAKEAILTTINQPTETTRLRLALNKFLKEVWEFDAP
jgi:hypothetical protein